MKYEKGKVRGRRGDEREGRCKGGAEGGQMGGVGGKEVRSP